MSSYITNMEFHFLLLHIQLIELRDSKMSHNYSSLHLLHNCETLHCKHLKILLLGVEWVATLSSQHHWQVLVNGSLVKQFLLKDQWVFNLFYSSFITQGTHNHFLPQLHDQLGSLGLYEYTPLNKPSNYRFWSYSPQVTTLKGQPAHFHSSHSQWHKELQWRQLQQMPSMSHTFLGL